MNINDYKDTNGNVEVSENLVSDIIDEINGVADYVVESGVNNNAEYIKYHSGRITIRNNIKVNSGLSILDIPFPILTPQAGKIRYSFANVATYLGSKNINVKSCYVETQSGNQHKIVIELQGTGIENLDVTYEINAWYK